MDFLAQAIAKKREETERHAALKTEQFGKKFVKRKELIEVESQLEQARKKQKLNDERPHDQPASNSASATDTAAADAKQQAEKPAEEAPQPKKTVAVAEVKRRLRILGEPITLFGESDEERLERLKLLEVTQSERIEGSKGINNVYQQIIQQEVAEEIRKAEEQALEREKRRSFGLPEDEEKDKKVEEKKVSKYDVVRPREECESAEEYIYFWIRRILREWESDLAARPEAEKRTMQGKVASALQKQTRHNIKTLMKLLKTKTVPTDILPQLENIVAASERLDYKAAHEVYVILSIGNAAWPMGVTMVGIHERSGREKIFSQHVAHVLNDETQRKYIQAVKRLITFCQNKRPSKLSVQL